MDQAHHDLGKQVARNFDAQPFMTLIGAQLKMVREGEVEIHLPFRADLLQQTGALHAGVVAALADTACGLAALTTMPPEANVLSVEFKLNLLAPAVGELIVARGRVVRAGRTLTVATADVIAGELLVATMLGTMIRR